MDEIDIQQQTLASMSPKRTAPYPRCNKCGMHGVRGSIGKCPFCGKGVFV